MSYRESRSHFHYYTVLRKILPCLCKNAQSVIDIGSNQIDLLSALDVPVKISLDKFKPLQKQGITSITADWLEYDAGQQYDVVCCFQVLEHIQDANAFAQKLLRSGKVVIISVPYNWKYRQGAPTGHINDPIDERKLFSWMEREYDFSVTCIENNGKRRLIACYYTTNKDFIKDIITQDCVFFPSPSFDISYNDDIENNMQSELNARKRELQARKIKKLHHKAAKNLYNKSKFAVSKTQILEIRKFLWKPAQSLHALHQKFISLLK